MRIPFAKMLAAFLFAAMFGLSGPSAAKAGSADDAILAELNFARQHPQEYAALLMREPVSQWEQALASDPAADDDVAAYAQAIAFLQRQSPLPPLRADDQLTAAALEHVAAQGPAGEVGHDGPRGERFDARLRRHGVEARLWAEDIAYGPRDPRDVVRELIIDRGVPDRGHRRNIFLASIRTAGVSCGPHRDYDIMCVIDFASPTREAAPRDPTPLARLQLATFEPDSFQPAKLQLATLDIGKTAAPQEGLLSRFFHKLLG
jgi:uncharacterized protein YkwD